MISLCMRIPRQTADWLHDVSKYFLLRGFYRKDIISTYSCRVGGGYFLQPLHCRGAGASENQLWGSLYKIEYLN